MATRTQVQLETATPNRGCIHQHVLERSYARERWRVHALCYWMTPHREAARNLELQVFLDAWIQPDTGGAGADDRLVAALAARFRRLFEPEACSGAAASRCAPPVLPALPRDAGAAVSAAMNTHAAVLALPAPQRLLYLLHDREGYDPATLAVWLHLDTRDCAHLIHQARQFMWQCLRAAA
ncbi:MAG: hypothetical protein ACRD1C_05370 [Terriglobales bacterium]